MSTKRSGWAIEGGPVSAPVYFTNKWRHGEVSLPRWSVMVEYAYLWQSRDGALAAAQEWALADFNTPLKGYRICEHIVDVAP